MTELPGRGGTRWADRIAGLGLVLMLALAPGPGAAQVILDASPGGLVEIPLVPADQPRPPASFGQKRVLVRSFGGDWVALVGLPLDLVPGRYIVQARPEGRDEPLVEEFTVFPRRSRRQSVVDLGATPPDPGAVALAWRETLDAAFPLLPPVAGPARPLFGRYRQVSQTETEHISFVAFDIDADTAVTAPGNGRVSAVTGEEPALFVWVDHGMGLYTCVGPLSGTARIVDDPVEAGSMLGRVTLDEDEEPRSLYWSVYLNGAAVDPFLLSDLKPASGKE